MDLIESRAYRRRLRELQADRARVSKAYEDEIKSLLGEPRPYDKIESLKSSSRFEDEMISDEIDGVVTDRLMAVIDKRLLAHPSGDGMWADSRTFGRRLLTRTGMAEARRVIREDLKSGREATFAWIAAAGTASAMATGLVGALTGLAALLLRMGSGK